jgi:hypothetical protein
MKITKTIINQARRCTTYRRLLTAFDTVTTGNNNALIEPMELFAPDLEETSTDAEDDFESDLALATTTHRMNRCCYNLDMASHQHDITLAELRQHDVTLGELLVKSDAAFIPRRSPVQPDAYTTPRRSPAQPDEQWTYTPRNSLAQPADQWSYTTPQRRLLSSHSTTPTAPFP